MTCPDCGSEKSMRAIRDGKPARWCRSCGTVYNEQPKRKKDKARESVEETNDGI